MNQGTYVFKVALALDVFVCALVFRDSAVTISSKTGLELRRAYPHRWARVLGSVLNFVERDHCELAIECDTARARAALVLLGGAL